MTKRRSPPKASTWPPAKARKPTLILNGEFRKAARAFPSLAATALHEAAHCVAGRYFGHPIKAVTLSDEIGGCVWMLYGASCPTVIRGTLVVLAAGEEAANRYQGKRKKTQDDRSRMDGEARRLLGLIASQDAVDAEISLARRRADRLVRMKWTDIVGAATELLTFHRRVSDAAAGRLENLD